MKRLIAYLRSMKFGIALLILVMAFSFAGSLVPQDRAATWYVENYPNSLGNLIVGLGVHRLFRTWYFVALISLLGLNLLLCTIIRFGSISKQRENVLRSTASLAGGHLIGSAAAKELRNWFKTKRYKEQEGEGQTVFIRNTSGYYGSFVVHLSLLLILLLGGLVLSLSRVTDYNINPNETKLLEDGTQLVLDSFRITDAAGRTEYASEIRITSPQGYQSEQREIKVNHPYTFRSNKYYQHTFGTCGSITATNIQTGGWDVFYLSERSFLSGDGGQGIWYEALFPGYVMDESGQITPLMMQTLIYPDPIYYVLVADSSGRSAQFMFPGDSIQIGEIEFTFNPPAHFSGIRVKRVPHPFLELLFASFALMVFGFWLCFFHQPAIVAIDKDRYKTGGSNSGVQLEIEAFLLNKKETDSSC